MWFCHPSLRSGSWDSRQWGYRYEGVARVLPLRHARTRWSRKIILRYSRYWFGFFVIWSLTKTGGENYGGKSYDNERLRDVHTNYVKYARRLVVVGVVRRKAKFLNFRHRSPICRIPWNFVPQNIFGITLDKWECWPKHLTETYPLVGIEAKISWGSNNRCKGKSIICGNSIGTFCVKTYRVGKIHLFPSDNIILG